MGNTTIRMTDLNISVPSEIFLVLHESENQFAISMKRYTALNLFKSNKLSLGLSAVLADMTEEDFIRFLGENKVSVFEYHKEKTLLEELSND